MDQSLAAFNNNLYSFSLNDGLGLSLIDSLRIKGNLSKKSFSYATLKIFPMIVKCSVFEDDERDAFLFSSGIQKNSKTSNLI